MKRFLFGSMALVALGMSAPAVAADMPVKVKAPPPVVYYDWSGAYVGFNIGAVWADVDRFYPCCAPGTGFVPTNVSTRSDDAIYGFHAGAQWQWGQWVLGVEAAYSAGFREMQGTSGALPVANGFAANLAAYNKITNLFTVGPRLGFAWDRWMIYGTGGYATADVKGQYVSTLTGLQVNQAFAGQSRNNGWFAGGGFEYMIHKGALVDVIVGAEYQHFDLRSERAFTDLAAPAPGPNTFDHDAVGDIVRARLTIKTQGFGWWGPM